jgi:DNA-binding PadR family transcriptional regulator
VRRKPGSLVPLESAILDVALNLDGSGVREFHGYQLARYLAHVSDHRLLTAYGTLYRALGRLEKMGLLTSRGEDPQIAASENRPARRLYALTSDAVRVARQHAPSRTRARKTGRRRVAPA